MFKKIFPALVIGLWAISGSSDELTADACCPIKQPKPNAQPCPKEACAPSCCNPPPPCCWNFNPCNPNGCMDMNCGGFYASADFLYWRAENHGFSYAFDKHDSLLTPGTGKVIRIHPDWAPAFRVGLGWNPKYDFWDVLLNYTWYQNKSSETRVRSDITTAVSTEGFYPLWPVSSNTTSPHFRHVRASSRIAINMFDLEIGRLMYLTKSVAIRPHWGATGGWIHQKFKDHFTTVLNVVPFTNELEFDGKNDYWGIGPRTGVHGEWHLWRGFSLLGKAAAALLYGQTQVKNVSETLAVGASSFVVDTNYSEQFNQLVPNLQLLFGFQWQTCFWCERMFFKMSAAWETNYWWDQFNIPVGMENFISPLPSVGNQPLTTEGLTLNFEWGF